MKLIVIRVNISNSNINNSNITNSATVNNGIMFVNNNNGSFNDCENHRHSPSSGLLEVVHIHWNHSSLQKVFDLFIGVRTIVRLSCVQLFVFQKGIQLPMKVSTIPGFYLPKGLASVLPVLISGLMCGISFQREQATNTLRTAINHTSADALKKFGGSPVKFSTNPNLSSTSTNLSAPHKNVRINAASALGLFMKLSSSVNTNHWYRLNEQHFKSNIVDFLYQPSISISASSPFHNNYINNQ
ncbi:hypothetical protein ACTFIU_010600 [Dictyostelium citrinum]